MRPMRTTDTSNRDNVRASRHVTFINFNSLMFMKYNKTMIEVAQILFIGASSSLIYGWVGTFGLV